MTLTAEQQHALRADSQVQRRALREPFWLMPLIDLGLVLMAFAIAYVMRYDLQLLRPVFEFNRAPFEDYLLYMGIYTVWLALHYQGSGLYRLPRGRSWFEEAWMVTNGATNATLVILAVSFALQPLVFSRLMMLYVAAVTILLLVSVRIIRRIIHARLRARGIGVLRVLVVGGGERARSILQTLLARRDLGYHAVGYLEDSPLDANVPDFGRVRWLGGVAAFANVVAAESIDHAIIAMPWAERPRILDLIGQCHDQHVSVSVVPDMFQLNLRQVMAETLDGIPLLRISEHPPLRIGSRLLKRALDLAIILPALPVVLLVSAFIALAIKLEDGGSIFYRQRRVGEGGRLFSIMKFRTMIPDADAMRSRLVAEHALDPRHPKIKDDPRITRIGKLLRKTSLDELPNLINVLLGQMSLVGPRPPTPDEVALYDEWHRARLNVKPGITGMWQISGRSDVPFDEMCLLDIYYIDNWSLRLDVQILLMTIPRVLLRDGAY